MKTLLSKLPFALILILIANILPVAGNLSLLGDFRLWVMMATTALIILSQPAFRQEENIAHRQSDRSSIFIILIMSIISVVTPIVHWAYFQEDKGPGVFTYAGIAIIIAGFALRIYAIRYLGRYFTATVQAVEGHRLITTGPYRFVRHPSYLGAYLVFIGGAVLFRSIPGFIVANAAMFFAYYRRIAAEETLLQGLFGDAYTAYKQKTYKMLPFIW